MEAMFYTSLDGNKVQCNLCNHRCIINENRRGICNVRENRAGVLITLVGKNLIAKHIDPIEKKPIFHLIPGSRSYSIATVGCNFRCRFCQNADIAQESPKKSWPNTNGYMPGEESAPEEIVYNAEKEKCSSISYTYTEPTVFFEFAFKTAKIARERGIKNVFVTNGYMTPEALDMISPYLDAANVDLKAFDEKFYKEICNAKLDLVKETLIKMKATGIFVEVTTLLIPELNDEKSEIEKLTTFIVKELGPETPWHVSRFHPTYKLTDRQPTPLETLEMAYTIGREAGLRYVYIGNSPDGNRENTYCYKCGKMIIERWGFSVGKYNIENGRCVFCNTLIDGVDL